ncbi:MAG TPA: class I SAM-dependent methyltransferase [Rhizomicrobium sp.]|jgi:S-adenosylmethionine-diacylgycerolhomoserine-N-methlytransferase|nr:class I SAM-dependent methyltransferase [Rhizomicrobium sp.]
MPPNDNPHGALMDRVYGRQRHFYDLTRRYYLFGRDRLIRGLDLAPGSSAVEIGCGTARNLIAIARRYPDARLFGLDASQAMLETANRAVARAGLSRQITLVQAYAESLSPQVFGEQAKFDCAFFSYSLSMIPDWLRALAAANRALSPSGRLHIVDFGDFSGLGRIGTAAMLAWLRQFHVEPRAEILRVLEQQAAETDHTLWVSPGRYAFVWNAQRFPDVALTDVAGQPHAEGNP